MFDFVVFTLIILAFFSFSFRLVLYFWTTCNEFRHVLAGLAMNFSIDLCKPCGLQWESYRPDPNWLGFTFPVYLISLETDLF